MVDITCIRGEGTHPEDDIVEPLLSDVSAALSRGRKELDEGALADEIVLETLKPNVRLGQLVSFEDSRLGTWRGKIVSISQTVSIDDSGNMSCVSSLTLRKPRTV